MGIFGWSAAVQIGLYNAFSGVGSKVVEFASRVAYLLEDILQCLKEFWED